MIFYNEIYKNLKLRLALRGYKLQLSNAKWTKLFPRRNQKKSKENLRKRPHYNLLLKYDQIIVKGYL
jgi:hypothetical protein